MSVTEQLQILPSAWVCTMGVKLMSTDIARHLRRYCLEAHARAGMVVDSATVAELMMHTLKSVIESPATPELRPWPEMDTGGKPALWWQR